MSSQVKEAGFQSSPPTSTPTLVRSRPKLPTIFGRGEDDGMQNLVGVISSLGSTDFVGKYSTKRRKRTTGEMSSQSQANVSLPVSPMSPVMSPRARSPPSDGKATITLTRMRSIKLKLEEVKEKQDRAAEMNNLTANIPRRKTGTVEPPFMGLGGVCLLRDSMHQSSSTKTLERSGSDRSDKILSTSSPSVMQSASHCQEKVDDLQFLPENEESSLLNRVNMRLSVSNTQTVDSDNPIKKTLTDDQHQHRISNSSKGKIDSVKSSPGADHDSNNSVHVTEYQKDNRDRPSSNEMEDEGIGAMDIEEDTSSGAHLIDKLSQSRNIPRDKHDSTETSSMEC